MSGTYDISYKPKTHPVTGPTSKPTSPKDQQVSKAAKRSFVRYEDRNSEGKILSRTNVHYVSRPIPKMKFQKHESFEALCTHMAKTRGLGDKADPLNAKCSTFNRSDLETEVFVSKRLKKKLGIPKEETDTQVKNFFKTETIYKHNSEFNGHSYKNEKGSYTKIHSAIASSADREALTTQNLSLVKTGGEKFLYAGRPDSFEKAKEEALFVLSHTVDIPLLTEGKETDKVNPNKPKWIEGKKGITWNEKTKCIEFSYTIYSLMSDSSLTSFIYSKIQKLPKEDELLLLNQEKEALARLKSGPIVIKDENGNVFKVQFKPIFFSQGFNSFPTFKGFLGEGTLSPPIMAQGWKELKARQDFAEKTKGVQAHVQQLEEYFAGHLHLSNLHLFIHMHLVLSAINTNEELPLVLHCKSTVDRTGMGVAILTALDQWKRLGKTIPADLSKLIDSKEEEFKELFFLNWLPTWNERARAARVHEGVCFGLGASRNPIMLECLPKRCLKESKSTLRWMLSGALATINTIGSYWKWFWVSCEPMFYSHSEQELSDWYARKQNALLQTKTTAWFPHMLFEENVAKYEMSRHKPKKGH